MHGEVEVVGEEPAATRLHAAVDQSLGIGLGQPEIGGEPGQPVVGEVGQGQLRLADRVVVQGGVTRQLEHADAGAVGDPPNDRGVLVWSLAVEHGPLDDTADEVALQGHGSHRRRGIGGERCCR